MKLKKTNNLKASKGKLQAFFFLALFVIVAFLLRFEAVAQPVADATGWDKLKMQNLAEDFVTVGIAAAILITAAIVFTVAAPIGIAIAAVGVIMLLPVIWEWTNDEITD